MEETRKCPACKSRLEKGFLFLDGGAWTPEKRRNVIMGFLRGGWPKKTVAAYKCPTCGKMEFYFEG